MPTEAPKTPEKKEQQEKPSPETRVDRNKKSENTLNAKRMKKAKELMEYEDRESTKILDEANKGEDAWHEAHRQRNNLTSTEQRTEVGKQADKKIDDIRKGKIDGKQRKGKPEDLIPASDIRERRGKDLVHVVLINE